MRVPLAWLRDYVDLPADPQAVAEMLAQIGFPVDGLERRPVITGVVIGRIAELAKHPNADRLQVGKIDVAGDAPLTIATAATNVAQGQTIAVATIGAQLPQLKIERRKMRGVESEGMMISAEELALSPEWFEDGIMQFDGSVPLGTDVVEYFRLSDAVLDVDVTSNRVDAMSMLGLARELAAYQGAALRMPATDYAVYPDDSPVSVTLSTPDCRRYVAQRFTQIQVGVSPAWLRIRLALAGQRPINNVVDISNYVMLEIGQPLHFYDASKIAGRHIIVRDAKPEERLVTLDDAEHELSPQALVIADEQSALGLAGLKGGKSSEVTPQTSEILLEAANFTGARVRRMSAQLALRTDAGTRHEKALPLVLTDWGAQRSAHLLTGQGARAHEPAAAGAPIDPAVPIAFPVADVKRLLGFELTPLEIAEFLDRLGFAVEPQTENLLRVTPPLWRRDVTLAADVVEEIARMAGYGRIEEAVPPIAAHDISSSAYDCESRVAHTLWALGYHEIMSYALHGAQVFERLERGGIEPGAHPLEVLNPLSEDQRYLRNSLLPSMLDYFARIDRPFCVFELGHVFSDEDGRPVEQAILSFGMAAEISEGPDWRDDRFLRIKGDAQTLVTALTGRRDVEVARDVREGMHPGKTAVVLVDGREVAVVGAVTPRLQQAFGVRFPVYVANVYLDNVPEHRIPRYVPPSKYPSTYRDLALLCDLDVSAAAVGRTISTAIGSLCTGVRAFDEYRGAQVAPDKKSLAIRLTLQKRDATITDEEADAAIERALEALRRDLHVTLRSSV